MFNQSETLPETHPGMLGEFQNRGGRGCFGALFQTFKGERDHLVLMA